MGLCVLYWNCFLPHAAPHALRIAAECLARAIAAIDEENAMIHRMCLICKRGRSTHARLNYHPRYVAHGFICGDCATDAAAQNAIARAYGRSSKQVSRSQDAKS
jgi:hypothetical protein